MWASEVKQKSEIFAQNEDIPSDIFFEFTTGRKLVFWVADFDVLVAVREPPARDVAQGSLSSLAAPPPRRGLCGAAKSRAAGRAAGPECGPCATNSQWKGLWP
jgi:hypothetical protein